MKLVLFDADGTLIDSQSTFLRFDYAEPTPEQTRSIIGLTLDRAIATILRREIDDEILAMAADYKQVYLQLAAIEEMQSRPFNGVPQFVRKLAARPDVLLGIVTGKSRRGVQKLLETAHFENLFVTSRCADDCPSKPHPAMVLECCDEVGVSAASTLVIGDTGFDMEMAVSAGATAMGVAWGYHPIERMLSAGAHCIVDSAHDLDELVGQWLNGEFPLMSSPLMPSAINSRSTQYA